MTTPNEPATDLTAQAHPTGFKCPECEEPAQAAAPTAIGPQFTAVQPWSHLDGQPLCPVIGEAGYEPAHAVPAIDDQDDTGLDAEDLAAITGLAAEDLAAIHVHNAASNRVAALDDDTDGL